MKESKQDKIFKKYQDDFFDYCTKANIDPIVIDYYAEDLYKILAKNITDLKLINQLYIEFKDYVVLADKGLSKFFAQCRKTLAAERNK